MSASSDLGLGDPALQTAISERLKATSSKAYSNDIDELSASLYRLGKHLFQHGFCDEQAYLKAVDEELQNQMTVVSDPLWKAKLVNDLPWTFGDCLVARLFRRGIGLSQLSTPTRENEVSGNLSEMRAPCERSDLMDYAVAQLFRRISKLGEGTSFAIHRPGRICEYHVHLSGSQKPLHKGRKISLLRLDQTKCLTEGSFCSICVVPKPLSPSHSMILKRPIKMTVGHIWDIIQDVKISRLIISTAQREKRYPEGIITKAPYLVHDSSGNFLGSMNPRYDCDLDDLIQSGMSSLLRIHFARQFVAGIDFLYHRLEMTDIDRKPQNALVREAKLHQWDFSGWLRKADFQPGHLLMKGIYCNYYTSSGDIFAHEQRREKALQALPELEPLMALCRVKRFPPSPDFARAESAVVKKLQADPKKQATLLELRDHWFEVRTRHMVFNVGFSLAELLASADPFQEAACFGCANPSMQADGKTIQLSSNFTQAYQALYGETTLPLLQTFLTGCCHPEPSQRYTVAEVVSGLRTLADDLEKRVLAK